MGSGLSWAGCEGAVRYSAKLAAKVFTKVPKKNRADGTIPPAHSFPSLSIVENPESKVEGLSGAVITIYGDFERFRKKF
jgi:hypothetical protein